MARKVGPHPLEFLPPSPGLAWLPDGWYLVRGLLEHFKGSPQIYAHIPHR